MKNDTVNPIPLKNKYEQIAGWVEGKIRNQQYPPGGFLPSEREISSKLSVSRVTVRLGLDRLKQRQLIQPVPGKGYRVLAGAHSRKNSRTYFIGGVFAGQKNPVSTGLISMGVSDVLEKKNFHLVYSSSDDLLQSEISKIRMLLKKKVDGLIIQPAYKKMPASGHKDELGNHEYIKQLYDGGIPVVLMDRSYGVADIPCVCNDDRGGGYMATEYLLKRGHQRVAFFGATIDRIGRQRHQGYLDAMAAHGAKPSIHLFNHLSIKSMASMDEFSLAETRKMLGALTDETGVFTFGMFAFILARLTSAPDYNGQAIEWIGYDFGPEYMAGNHKPFPYVKRPMEEIGRRAAEKMLTLLNNDGQTAAEFVKPTIVDPARMI